jgi:hypothetical protein
MPTDAQLRKIHALRGDLHLDEDDYHAMLAAYTDSHGRPVASAQDLTVEQASALIDSLEKVIDRTPEVRDRVYASAKQVALIEALWARVSRAKDPRGRHRTLDSFLHHHFHIRRSEHIPRTFAPKIIKALRIMNEQRDRGTDKPR